MTVAIEPNTSLPSGLPARSAAFQQCAPASPEESFQTCLDSSTQQSAAPSGGDGDAAAPLSSPPPFSLSLEESPLALVRCTRPEREAKQQQARKNSPDEEDPAFAPALTAPQANVPDAPPPAIILPVLPDGPPETTAPRAASAVNESFPVSEGAGSTEPLLPESAIPGIVISGTTAARRLTAEAAEPAPQASNRFQELFATLGLATPPAAITAAAGQAVREAASPVSVESAATALPAPGPAAPEAAETTEAAAPPPAGTTPRIEALRPSDRTSGSELAFAVRVKPDPKAASEPAARSVEAVPTPVPKAAPAQTESPAAVAADAAPAPEPAEPMPVAALQPQISEAAQPEATPTEGIVTEAVRPETAWAEAVRPETKSLADRSPDAKSSGTKLPEMKSPDTRSPEVKSPEAKSPEAKPVRETKSASDPKSPAAGQPRTARNTRREDPRGEERSPESKSQEQPAKTEADNSLERAESTAPDTARSAQTAAAHVAAAPEPAAAKAVETPTPEPSAAQLSSDAPEKPVSRSAQEIALRVSSGDDRKVNVRFTERAGEVRVSVRTPDETLARSLREDLGSLSTKLSQSGYAAETWAPSRADSSMLSDHRGASENQDFNGNTKQDSQQNGGSGSRQHPQDEGRGNRPSWIEELENSTGQQGFALPVQDRNASWPLQTR